MGNELSHFTQWDVNQTITVRGLDYERAPKFHFCNQNSKRAIEVQSKFTLDGDLIVDVPNILLQEALKLQVYVYYKIDGIGKTMHIFTIPITHKPKPIHYKYKNNIDNDQVNTEILKIEKISAEGLIDTYRITFANGLFFDFTVTNGKSAYEIAVEHGFDGSEEDWLKMLKGEELDIKIATDSEVDNMLNEIFS